VVPADVEAPDQVGQRAAAVRGDQLQVRIAVEEAVEDAARDGERGVEGEADRRGELELVHAQRLGSGRRRRMNEHGQLATVYLGPDLLEGRIGKSLPADIRQYHDPNGPRVAGAFQLLQSKFF